MACATVTSASNATVLYVSAYTIFSTSLPSISRLSAPMPYQEGLSQARSENAEMGKRPSV
jgi:hypothetical protein